MTENEVCAYLLVSPLSEDASPDDIYEVDLEKRNQVLQELLDLGFRIYDRNLDEPRKYIHFRGSKELVEQTFSTTLEEKVKEVGYGSKRPYYTFKDEPTLPDSLAQYDIEQVFLPEPPIFFDI